MSWIPIHQVDAFTAQRFGGNPAAVCPLEAWLPDALMQSIAAENNLSETAFICREGAGYRIRWFTPKAEVDLCGHATLASAYVVLELLEPSAEQVVFESRSGPLTVTRQGDGFEMDFPARALRPITPPEGVITALGATAVDAVENDHLVLIELPDEAAVRALRPDFGALLAAERRCVVVTARGEAVDFVSRFFAPAHDIPEDPVTGSAHCSLVPYWAQRLDRTEFEARQLSARGGALSCTLAGDRVRIRGQAVPVLVGRFFID